MSPNETIFRYLHGLAGESLAFDTLAVFSGTFLIFWMLAAVFAVIVIFVYVEEFRGTPMARRRWTRFAQHAFFAFFTAVIAYALAETVKYVYPLARPFIALPDITPLFEHGAHDSFPSGHATFSFALAVYMLFENRLFGGILLAGALIVSLSRVVIGIHWPLDILAGALLGTLVALTVWFIVTRFSATIGGYND